MALGGAGPGPAATPAAEPGLLALLRSSPEPGLALCRLLPWPQPQHQARPFRVPVPQAETAWFFRGRQTLSGEGTGSGLCPWHSVPRAAAHSFLTAPFQGWAQLAQRCRGERPGARQVQGGGSPRRQYCGPQPHFLKQTHSPAQPRVFSVRKKGREIGHKDWPPESKKAPRDRCLVQRLVRAPASGSAHPGSLLRETWVEFLAPSPAQPWPCQVFGQRTSAWETSLFKRQFHSRFSLGGSSLAPSRGPRDVGDGLWSGSRGGGRRASRGTRSPGRPGA